MRGAGVLPWLGRFLWRYLATALLVGGLAAAMVRLAVAGTGPVPQEPPDGYAAASGRISLEWNRGTRKEPITLQVSVDDPSFRAPVLTRPVSGGAFTLTDVRPGKTYYWRLLQAGDASPTATFEVPASYVEF